MTDATGNTTGTTTYEATASDLASLLSAVNEASARAGVLWLSFLMFMAYLTLTVGSVTHEFLLLQKPIKLPVLGVDLPLIGFFAITPLFFLLFHFYLFLQLTILTQKVMTLERGISGLPSEDRARYRIRLDSFLIVQFLSAANEAELSSRQNDVQASHPRTVGRLLRSVATITIVILPIALLLQFQLTFLPYHEPAISWVHRVAIVVDLGLIWIFWSAIERGSGQVLPSFNWHGLFGARGLRRSARQRLSSLLTTCRRHALGLLLTGVVIATSLFVLAFGDETVARAIKLPVGDGTWRPLADIALNGRINMVEGRPKGWWFSNVLVVPNKRIANEEAIDGEFPARSLRGRNLSGAVLINSDLRNVDFTGANLNDARLDGALLSRARFGCASRYDKSVPASWPEDECTWLLRASFSRAQLQATNFQRARMHGANLIAANLEAADLTSAQMQGALLSNATLAMALLKGAVLNYSHFDYANLIGAGFQNVQMHGILINGLTTLHLSSIYYKSTVDLDRLGVRVAKPLTGHPGAAELALNMSKQFLFAAVRPEADGLQQFDAEYVDPGFDVLKVLLKLRKEVLGSVPFNIIEGDFEHAYERSTVKHWDEIAKIVSTNNDTSKIRDYLTELACDDGSVRYIAPAIIRRDLIGAAGPHAAEVVATLKQCLQSKLQRSEDWVILSDLEKKYRSNRTSQSIISVDFVSKGEAAVSNFAPSHGQTVTRH